MVKLDRTAYLRVGESGPYERRNNKKHQEKTSKCQAQPSNNIRNEPVKAEKPVVATTPKPPSSQPQQQLSEELVSRVSEATGMDPKWAKLCLRQNNDDYNQAMNIFQKMKAEDKIPKHFFFNRGKLDAIHDELRNKFIEVTGMFEEYADKCLRENNWDWMQSLNDFNFLNSEGQIPPQCFYRHEGQTIFPSNKNMMVFEFASMTNMRPQWAEKCLSDMKWSWQDAEAIFKKMKIENQIPEDFFYSTNGNYDLDGTNAAADFIKKFSIGSGLTEDWARKILEDAQWNYIQATRDFAYIKAHQDIPADAFIP